MKPYLLFCFLLGSMFKLAAQPYSLTITEINYHPDSTTNCGDWFELHNYGSSTIDLSNWRIRDRNPLNLYLVPNNVSIPAGGYLVFCQDSVKFDQFHSIPNRIGNFPFGLNNSWDSIKIFDASLTPVVQMKYVDSIPWPKGADGYGRTLELLQVGADLNDFNSWRTGCVLGSPGGPRQPCTNERLIVSEINYSSDPSDDSEDWIELRNLDNFAKDLSGYRFRDRRGYNVFTFPPGTNIGPNGFLVIYRDPVKFFQQHPAVTNTIGPFNFGLSSAGDAVRIYNQNDHVIYSVRYYEKAPWPTEANGNGYTLEYPRNVDPDWDVNSWKSWGFGCRGGSPGFLVPTTCFVSNEEIEVLHAPLPFPNPVNSYINPGREDIQISGLFDLTGRNLITLQLEPGNALNVEGLPPGIYILQRTISDQALPPTKIIIQP
jgi:hypothetical protein